MIATLLLAIQVSTCGVEFSLPDGWTWTPRSVNKDSRHMKPVKCALSLTPPRWVEINEPTPWPTYSPAALYVFVPGTSMDDAGYVIGMTKNEDGRYVGSSRGVDPLATPFTIGRWSGWRAGGWHRGYADDAKRDKLAPDESRVFSGNHDGWLAAREGTVIALDCSDGTPAYAVDCEALYEAIFPSLK